MFSSFDYSVIANSWGYLFKVGMAFTLKLTALSMLGGVALGTLLAMARLAPLRVLSLPAAAYVNLVRAVPLVLVIFWFYFLVPYIAAWVIGANEPVKVGTFMSALITFTLFQAAYYCEIMRGGIQAVPKGQAFAAQALGMGYWLTMSQIILPQAFRNMLPLLLTQTIVLFQDVSLVYVLSVADFVGAASKIAQRDGRLVEMYVFVALVYFILCTLLSWLVRRLQRRISFER